MTLEEYTTLLPDDAIHLSSAERRKRSERYLGRLHPSEKDQLSPVSVRPRGKICRSFWGKNWCQQIETYPDYEFRLSQGRSSIRCSEVLDLKILPAKAVGKVLGDTLHQVSIQFCPLENEARNAIQLAATKSPHSVLQILQGELSDELKEALAQNENGIFPCKDEIQYDCDCIDNADLCQHVAACLYGIAVKFDQDPALFFTLRQFNPAALSGLLDQNGLASHSQATAAVTSNELGQIFDIEIDSL